MTMLHVLIFHHFYSCNSIENIVNLCHSTDSSSSDSSQESIHSLSPWFPKKDNNGLIFAPDCDDLCFLRKAECDHVVHEVTLNIVGGYVVFPSIWYHRGFFSVKGSKTIIQAQLFAVHSADPAKERLTRKNTRMDSYTTGRINRTLLDALRHDLISNWDQTYSGFPPCAMFSGEVVDQEKNRHIRSEKFKDLPRIDELVRMFKAEFPHLDVDSVWLLQKTRCEDGFQTWHRDFALGQKITTTIVVNVGSFKSIH